MPSLPPSPPNLLKASELNSHVRPVVVLPPQPPEPTEVTEDLIDTSSPVSFIFLIYFILRSVIICSMRHSSNFNVIFVNHKHMT